MNLSAANPVENKKSSEAKVKKVMHNLDQIGPLLQQNSRFLKKSLVLHWAKNASQSVISSHMWELWAKVSYSELTSSVPNPSENKQIQLLDQTDAIFQKMKILLWEHAS